MTTTTEHETEIDVDPDVPRVRVTREFDAPAAKVFRAHVDPDLFFRWNRPEGMEAVDVHVDRWDAQTGGAWRYHVGAEGEGPACGGSFHEVRDGELIVHTFEISYDPGNVVLTKVGFEDLGDGRSRLTETTVLESFEARDNYVAGAIEGGVAWTHEQLDALLAAI